MKFYLFLTLLAGLVVTGCTNVRTVGNINGLQVTRVTTRGVFSPSTTTVVLCDTNKPGSIEAVVANAGGPGVLPAVANAGGMAGGAALLRPSRTRVETSAGASSTGGNAASSGSGSNTQNGSVHHNTGNGNGSGNNGNH